MKIADGRFVSAVAEAGGARHTLTAAAFIAAAGGFEANIEWLGRWLGRGRRRNFFVRGTRYNRGSLLKAVAG